MGYKRAQGVLKVEGGGGHKGCKGNMAEQGVCNGVIRRVRIGNLKFWVHFVVFLLFLGGQRLKGA